MSEKKSITIESKAKQAAAKLKGETVKTFSTLMTSAFGLVAAFAWNETVKDAINKYIPQGDGLKSKLIYAIFVTFVAVVVSFQLGSLAAKYSDNEDE